MLKIKIGPIGASKIAKKIIPLLSNIEQLEFVGVAARSQVAAATFAERHALERAYRDYAECLGDSAVDAVYISTLNSNHATQIRDALCAGKHVLCEKPIVLNLSEAEELYALANKKN